MELILIKRLLREISIETKEIMGDYKIGTNPEKDYLKVEITKIELGWCSYLYCDIRDQDGEYHINYHITKYGITTHGHGSFKSNYGNLNEKLSPIICII